MFDNSFNKLTLPQPIKISFILLGSFLSLSLLLLSFSVQTAVGEAAGSGPVSPTVMDHYDVPFANGSPRNLIVEPGSSPPSIWFTMPEADAIGNLVVTSTVDYQFTRYPVTGVEPFDLAYDSSRDWIWFTLAGSAGIGYFAADNPAVITEVNTLSGENPAFIDVAPGGDVWFTEPAAQQFTRYQLAGSQFETFEYTYNCSPAPCPQATPTHLAVLDDNSVWFIDPVEFYLVEYNPVTQSYNANRVRDNFIQPAFTPSALTMDDNEPWVGSTSKGWVGRYAPGTLTGFLGFDLPIVNSGINSMAYSEYESRELWFTLPDKGRVGMLRLSSNYKFNSYGEARVTEDSSSRPLDIVAAADGNVWIADAGANTIGQWQAPYLLPVYLPQLIK